MVTREVPTHLVTPPPTLPAPLTVKTKNLFYFQQVRELVCWLVFKLVILWYNKNIMICKGCSKEFETTNSDNKQFCENKCYWKFRRTFSGTDVLPGTKPRSEIGKQSRLKRQARSAAFEDKLALIEAKEKERRKKIRLKAMDAYGGRKCACCGEDIYEFLQIEHMDGIGKYKTNIPRAGYLLAHYLIKNNFPPGYQVLCVNCNFAKRFGDPCPHSLIRAGVYNKSEPTNGIGGEALTSPTNAPDEVNN
jgi:hypothetical protein